MKLITFDAETYWSQTHSLSKMNPAVYIMHPETEIQSAAIKEGDGETFVLFGDELTQWIRDTDFSDTMLLGHNMSGFDAAILAWRFKVKPKAWGCTLAMARHIGAAQQVGGSLKALAAHYGVGAKLDLEATNTKGKKLADFTDEEIEAMREYNKVDTDLCHALFKCMLPEVDTRALRLIDMTIRMMTEPKFVLDRPLLERTLVEIDRKKHDTLLAVGREISPLETGVEDDELIELARATLSSAPKFAKLLESRGVPVPMKLNKKGKEIPALAKTDEGMQALVEHEDEDVAMLAEARLGVKSTQLETRINSFLDVGAACRGRLPVFLNYAGAGKTLRWSAASFGLNQQNLPRIGKKPQLTDSLRKSLRAPKGHKIVVADLSGIELRVMHFLWKVGYSTEMYRADPAETDLYVDFASKFYKKPVDEVSKEERQVGKVCLAEGTLVLTDQGEIPIEQVTASHRVWDGVEWVPTDGAIYNGEREVITYDGITATPDHEVWVEDGRKVQIGYAAAQSLRLARGRTCGSYVGAVQAGGHRGHPQKRSPIRPRRMHRLWESVRGLLPQFTDWQDIIMQRMCTALWCPELAYQSNARSQGTMQQPQQSLVLQLRRTWDRVSVCLQRSRGRMGDGESWVAQGYGAGPHRQQRALRAGESALGQSQAERSQQEERAFQEIPHIQSGASRGPLCGQHPEKSHLQRSDRRGDCRAVAQTLGQTKRRVWDLLNCGPRHRFTANGRLVSNCHLQLQYGSGAAKFTFMAKTMGGVTLEQEESQRVVDAYRGLHPEIVHGWRVMTGALTAILHGTVGMELDPCGLCHTIEGGIESPRGRLYYPNLKCERNPETGYMEWTYEDRNPRTRKVEPVKIYGAKLGQNLVQYLAREVMCDMMLEIQKIAPIIHTVHDEVILAVPESEAEDTLAEVQHIMRSGVSWFPDLVTWSDGSVADNYGEAK